MKLFAIPRVAALVCAASFSAAAQSTWTTLPSPNPSASSNLLYGVGGTSASDVWAVGSYIGASSDYESLALHWDGAQWTHVSTPSPTEGYLIRSVAALTPDDVWAVGGHGRAYAFHFDGSAWSASLLPQPGTFGFGIAVSDVVALAPDDVWAVGWYDFTGSAHLRTAVWHWDGASWSVVPSPSAPNTSGGAYPSMLLSIDAVAADEIFAVGEWRIGNTWFPLVLRYDGATWQLQDAPVSVHGDGRLRAVSAHAANDVWAVGTADDDTGIIGGGFGEAFALHFDGTEWSVVATPQPSSWGVSPLRSVLALGGQAFAVGSWENATQGLDTLILHIGSDLARGFSIVPSTSIPGNGQGWNELFDIARFDDELWALGYGNAAFGAPNLTLVERAASMPGTPHCFGDGSATPCPCGNGGGPGEGCRTAFSNEEGGPNGATLSGSGNASVSDDSVVLIASDVTAQPGLFFQGDQLVAGGNGSTFGDGIRCCGTGVIRLEVAIGAGPEPTTTHTSLAISAHPQQSALVGTSKCYQYWFRVPGQSACGSNFNLSNAYVLSWGP